MARGLADIPLRLASEAQQAALMRLQLYALGKTHELLRDLANGVRGALLDVAGRDEVLDGMELHLAQRAVEDLWSESYKDWSRLFEALRREAAGIPFGSLAVQHRSYFADVVEESLQEAEAAAGMVGGGWYYQQLGVLIDAAEQRTYGDGLRLSERLWNLDKRSLDGIMQNIYNAVANGNSAWDLAGDLEQYLGAGADCPRWTWDRLYGLTKQNIADGDRTGLFSGDECAGQGVSYNALRLLRNEIQTIHHAGTDMVLARMPWVEQEEIHLSPSHPDIGCECEDVVISGEDGTGVYSKGTISLPIHVNCLCYKTAVTMDADEFARRARGWMTGGRAWRAMDQYADWLGVPAGQQITAAALDSVGGAMVDWLWGGRDTLDGRVADAMERL